MRDGHRNECKACSLKQKHHEHLANPEFQDHPIRLAHAAAYLLHRENPDNPPRVRLLIGG